MTNSARFKTSNEPKEAPDESLVASPDNSSPLLTFIVDEAPEAGSAIEVADGVFWLRFPLPMKGLNHINLWALRDGDGWVVVDTGIGSSESKDIWRRHFEQLMGGRPVNRVIVTHLHPDHSGLAGWMCRKFGAPLVMTRGEYFLCRLMAADTGSVAPREGLNFYKKAGYTEDQLELYKTRFGGFGKAITPMPHSYDRIIEGDTGMIDGREWRVIIGSGHSPEHAVLWCPELKIALSGDQILPNISSNVSHHEKALERLYEHCKTPRLATEVYPVLFRRSINDGNRIMAVGESIAHLNCLKERGRVSRRLNDAGQFTYKSDRRRDTNA